MGIFGWSYPPGVSRLPADEEYPCVVCGKWDDDCICPECPECGGMGDPVCYRDHGMQVSEEQRASLAAAEAEWEADNNYDPGPMDEWEF